MVLAKLSERSVPVPMLLFLRSQRPQHRGLLGTGGAQGVHLDFHTAPGTLPNEGIVNRLDLKPFRC